MDLYNGGLSKDNAELFRKEGTYIHARNAFPGSHTGDKGYIGNEPANLDCITLPYELIGAISAPDGQWILFSTDNIDSEIGLFIPDTCSYTQIVNDKCLGFKQTHLISGVARRTFDCGVQVYWADALNPDRVMDIKNPPYIMVDMVVDDCVVSTPTSALDCDALRLAPLLDIPCLTLDGRSGNGTLPNGSYQVAIAYLVKGVRVSDYLALSNTVSVWTRDNLSNGINLTIDGIDSDFDEIEVVVISLVAGQTVARKLGTFSSRIGSIFIDTVPPDNSIVDLSLIPVRTPVPERSDAMFGVGDYLIRSGIYNQEEPNYQPLANQIKCQWLIDSMPANYHMKGGRKVGYCPDEVYCFWIRGVYNTGEKTASYHIPGRAPNATDFGLVTGPDAEYETNAGIIPYRWRVYNTASLTGIINQGSGEGGTYIARGEMAYWESSLRYPDNMADVWGDLCGKPIRHHKMPDGTTHPLCRVIDTGANAIRLIVPQFYNIQPFVDKNGQVITSIVGFEILRGSREGNKTILSRGIINNMRGYTDPLSGSQGWYQNFPYNEVGSDYYHTDAYSQLYEESTLGKNARKIDETVLGALTDVSRNVYSFHGPDTSGPNRPYMSPDKIKIYHTYKGFSEGIFEEPWKHPKNKQMTNFFATLIDVLTVFQFAAQLGAAPFLSVDIEADSDTPVKSSMATPFINFSAGGDIAGSAALIGNLAALAISTTNNLIMMSYLAVSGIYGRQLTKIFMAFIPPKQYALQYNSHGYYDDPFDVGPNNQVRRITKSQYVKEGLTTFAGRTMNNVMRGGFVGIETGSPFAHTHEQWGIPDPNLQDFSRPMAIDTPDGVKKRFTKTKAGQELKVISYYTALKMELPSQYGEIESVKQIPVTCVYNESSTSGVYGGDEYMGRYTEKNPFPLFNNWMVDEPDETEFDYRQGYQIPFPRYWTWTLKNQNDLVQQPSMYRHLTRVGYTGTNLGGFPSFTLIPPPSPRHITEGWFYMKDAYFYLSVNGVRDFWCGSEMNLGYRDWEDNPAKRFYDPANYTALGELFRTDRLKDVVNQYKYDYSLSASKMYNQYISWGQMLPRSFDPTNVDCYTYYPRRIMNSLPQQEELKRDNWRWFLPNNYKDLSSVVTAIKSFKNSGALILFRDESPAFLQGTTTLNASGLDLSIGSGALLAQPLQYLSNADKPLGYGACQSRLGVVSIPHGIFWVSQKQGKIMAYTGQLSELNDFGLDNWLSKYLPSETLRLNPAYPYPDNLLIGVGCAMTYDPTHEILYVTKTENKRLTATGIVPSGNPNTPQYGVVDNGWTVSFDMVEKEWIGWHDWHPYWMIPLHDHFITVKNKKLWKHNSRWDLYCNYYTVDYPFEVMTPVNTKEQVAILRSVEYQLEAYRYKANNQDRFHVLDWNFDRAWVDNSEQHSGLLRLNLKNKINPVFDLQFPTITLNWIDILYSKEEQKYRFNQFWDTTKNRGEFSSIQQTQAIITQDNGYVLDLNPLYFNYNKPALERKKIRHYASRVFLSRLVSGNTKMLLKLNNPKLVQSLR